MPPVRNRGRAVPSGPSRVKITPVIAKPTQPRPKKEAPTCVICIDDLECKRVTRVSCGHRFHWTCMVNCLERAKYCEDQTCPLCRAEVEYLSCGRKRVHGVETFGRPQQPTLWLMHAENMGMTDSAVCARTNVEKNCVETVKDLARARVQLAEAIERKRSSEFVDDIKEEILKLEKRRRIYLQMRRLFNTMTVPEPDRRVEWDYEYEKRRANGATGAALRPHPPSIFSRSDSEASYHSSEDEVEVVDVPDSEEEAEDALRTPTPEPTAPVRNNAHAANRATARPSSGAPRPSSGAPRPSTGAPRPSSGAPRPSSSAPRPSSGAPRPSSGAPRPSSGAPRPSVRRSVNARNGAQAAVRAATLDDDSDSEEQAVRTPRTRLAAAKEEEERAGVANRLRSRQL